jgi:hypothetical protein
LEVKAFLMGMGGLYTTKPSPLSRVCLYAGSESFDGMGFVKGYVPVVGFKGTF